tara:strand:+ start:2459 stop:2614 length:156 start_codon:yes stop_codon:yes gene_type:complete
VGKKFAPSPSQPFPAGDMVTAPVAVLAMSMIIGSAMGADDRLASPEAARIG